MAKKTITVSGFTKDQREKDLEKIKKKYEKNGYVFVEYIDDGMTKSTAIFEVDEAILKKEKLVKMVLTIVIVFFIALISFSSSGNEKKITKEEYGDKWAFTYDEAVLKCYKDGDIKSPVIELNGIPYGLTGFADNKYGQSDLNALNKYWLEDTRPYMKGTHISISIFSEDALKLCK